MDRHGAEDVEEGRLPDVRKPDKPNLGRAANVSGQIRPGSRATFERNRQFAEIGTKHATGRGGGMWENTLRFVPGLPSTSLGASTLGAIGADSGMSMRTRRRVGDISGAILDMHRDRRMEKSSGHQPSPSDQTVDFPTEDLPCQTRAFRVYVHLFTRTQGVPTNFIPLDPTTV